MTKPEVDAVLKELLDAETKRIYDLWASDYAIAVLGMHEQIKSDTQARIESARAAKAQGVPLWQWAERYGE